MTDLYSAELSGQLAAAENGLDSNWSTTVPPLNLRLEKAKYLSPSKQLMLLQGSHMRSFYQRTRVLFCFNFLSFLILDQLLLLFGMDSPVLLLLSHACFPLLENTKVQNTSKKFKYNYRYKYKKISITIMVLSALLNFYSYFALLHIYT